MKNRETPLGVLQILLGKKHSLFVVLWLQVLDLDHSRVCCYTHCAFTVVTTCTSFTFRKAHSQLSRICKHEAVSQHWCTVEQMTNLETTPL